MSNNIEFDIPMDGNVQKLVKSINDSQAMELNKNDIMFIGLIAGLQIIRQWLNKTKVLNRERFNDQQEAERVKHNKFMNDIETKKGDRVKWILGPTTYDAIRRSSNHFRKVGVGGRNHRYETLAHDPLVGLLVGPINLLSNTITYNTEIVFGTSNVIPSRPNDPSTGYLISSPSSFMYAINKSIQVVQSDKTALVDAIIKHLLHLASDIGTKQGLIIPGLSLLPNVRKMDGSEVNAWLIKNEFDVIWSADIFAQFGISELINSISSIMYKFLLYRDSKKSKEFINAKCQKVIAIANAVSSAEDLMIAGIRGMTGNWVDALRELDWGGLLATIKRLLQSDEFKNEIKGISHTWDNLVFNARYSAADIENEFQENLKSIDQKYSVIIKKMEQEYLEYGELELLAADLNISGKKMFMKSADFSDLNKVNGTLRSERDINEFFNN